MANLEETREWAEGIYQLEKTDRVLGGTDGVANRQGQQLANRTLWLKEKVESTESALTEHEEADDPHPQYVTEQEMTDYVGTVIVQGQVNADWNATDGAAYIKNKPVLSAVATSGNYADLQNKPVAMTGATAEAAGTSGFVPAPSAGDEDKVLTGAGEWKYLSGIAIGQEVMHYGTTPPPGCLICDGSEVGRATYPELYAVIGTTYGEGDGEITFNLPDRIGRFGQGSLIPGQYIEAGLPNITGSFRTYATDGLLVEGAFSQERIGAGNAASVGANENKYTLSAADSNPIYGKSDTVQPPALTLLPCIKAFDAAVNPGMVNITELANEITGKVDKVVNGKNIAYIVDSYHDDEGNWYRKWSDGWVEQGGQFLSAVGVGAMSVVNLHFPADVVYFGWSMANTATDGTASSGGYTQPDTTKINFYQGWAGGGNPVKWYACGMGAE